MFRSYRWVVENLHNPDVIVLDSRQETTYRYGHIPGSQSLMLDRVIRPDRYGANLAPDAQQAADVFGKAGIDKTKTVVVTGDLMDPSAARIAWTLNYFGHKKTFLMEDPGELWRNSSKMTRRPAEVAPARFVPEVDPLIRTDAAAIQDGTGITLIDARSPQEYMRGHLPGSILIPFTDGLGTDGRLFLDGNRLEGMFRSRGVEGEGRIVCYCMHGHRASSLYFQLRTAGFGDVALYDGSFADWYGRGLPLE